MKLGMEEVARAFSGHRFAEAAPYIAPQVNWAVLGAGDIEGRDAVLAACRDTAEELKNTDTKFLNFDVTTGQDRVVVDSTARYTESGGDVSTVASCDIYRFEDGQVVSIRSYNVELPD